MERIAEPHSVPSRRRILLVEDDDATLVSEQRSRRRELAQERDREKADPFLRVSAIRQLRDVAGTVASTGSSLLIVGETGSGKGAPARWIHDHSAWKDEAFVSLNGAGLNREFQESELFGRERGAVAASRASWKSGTWNIDEETPEATAAIRATVGALKSDWNRTDANDAGSASSLPGIEQRRLTCGPG